MIQQNVIRGLLAACILLLGTQAWSQKIGYLNSAAILAQFPQTKTADEQLKTFQDGLVAEGEKRAAALQQKFNAYIEEANTGTLTRVQMQERENNLQLERQQLAEYEQEVMEKVTKKREELYTPILNKVQEAIDAVGKEKGYQFIFDTSAVSVIVFADESDDVSSLVKAKLNM